METAFDSIELCLLEEGEGTRGVRGGGWERQRERVCACAVLHVVTLICLFVCILSPWDAMRPSVGR